MNRLAVSLLLAGAIAAFVLTPLAGPAGAGEKNANAREVVGVIMKELRGNTGTVRVGMAADDADAATKGAALHIGERHLPLAGSWLDKKKALNGTVCWDVRLDDKNKLDIIRVVLLTGPYDRVEMGETIIATGKRIGLAMEPDDADPNTWFDYEAKGIELWISLGEELVVIEANLAE